MSFYDDDSILNDIPISRADRKRCIVCGSKKGDCTSKDFGGPKHIIALGQDEKLAAVDEIVVPEDIWQDTEISPGVWSKTLVVRGGTLMKKKKAKELGII